MALAMKSRVIVFGALLAVAGSWACGGDSRRPAAVSARPQIGLLLDSLEHERWRRDQELFTTRVQELRGDVVARVANGDVALQEKQAQELLDQGVKVLVVVATDAEKAASIVDAAKKKNVRVISYDRLIRNADVDLYVSFDSLKVGEMQAQYLFNQGPRGNYVLIGGSPKDHNAKLVRDGQMKVLKPAVSRGHIKIVFDGWAEGWRTSEAKSLTEQALKKVRKDVTAVVASNDATAEGAVQALQAAGLAGKVLVSGQDAELNATRRLIAGTQTMTVYKPLRSLARLAAGAAMTLAKGDSVETVATINNGKKEVPAMLVEPITVDKENLDRTVIADGFQKREDVYGKS